MATFERNQRRLDASTNPEKKTFYQSTKIAVEAAIAYIRKYGKALRDAATVEPDSERKAELEELAWVSDKISFEKPETFFEAIQLFWYTHLIANLDNGCAMSFSRFDQYMYPFYRDDLKAGRITPERARELICALFYKINSQKCAGAEHDGRGCGCSYRRASNG